MEITERSEAPSWIQAAAQSTSRNSTRAMVNMDYLRGTTPPASIMGRDGQLLGGTLGGIRNATMHPMEFVLRALGGNIHNLRNYNGPYASVEGGIWMNANEVNLRAINLNASGGLSNAAIQQQPTLYEGPDPIYLTDFVPSIDTSMTSLTWDDTISLAATLPTRKSVGEEAEDADPTTVKETITVSRQPMTIKLDNMLLMSPIAAAEYATMIMNQTWGVIGSNEIMNGDGSAPNQQGIFDRIGSGATYRKNFSRGTGNIYANFIRAVNQAQAERVKRGFIGGEVVVEPLLLYALSGLPRVRPTGLQLRRVANQEVRTDLVPDPRSPGQLGIRQQSPVRHTDELRRKLNQLGPGHEHENAGPTLREEWPD